MQTMMGQKTSQPKLYTSFSLDGAVPADHILRKIAAYIDFSFARDLTRFLHRPRYVLIDDAPGKGAVRRR
jgi:hypothetical protein